MLAHLVAHAVTGARPLASAEACDALFAALRRRFVQVAAACLMPDHVHLLANVDDADCARRALAQSLAGFSRAQGNGPQWQRVPLPDPIRDMQHLARQVRYVHLNPCRARLVDDPLCWSWSTHRGAIGAELDPWVSPADMAAWLQHDERDVPRWLHDYVSSDPSVNVRGTPFPVAATSQRTPVVPLADIVEAATAAVPGPGRAPLRRKLFVLLARHQGWRDAQLLADTIGISPGRVRYLSAQSDPALLHVGALYLGDPRLRYAHDFRRPPRF